MGRDSSVSKATAYGLDGLGSSPCGERSFAHVQTSQGVHTTSCAMGTVSFPVVKRWGRGDVQPCPSSTELTKVKGYTSIRLLGFRGLLEGKHYLYKVICVHFSMYTFWHNVHCSIYKFDILFTEVCIHSDIVYTAVCIHNYILYSAVFIRSDILNIAVYIHSDILYTVVYIQSEILYTAVCIYFDILHTAVCIHFYILLTAVFIHSEVLHTAVWMHSNISYWTMHFYHPFFIQPLALRLNQPSIWWVLGLLPRGYRNCPLAGCSPIPKSDVNMWSNSSSPQHAFMTYTGMILTLPFIN
jgi:hypothetical protein